MGDASDHADVGRFMRTSEGQQVLDRFRAGLVGKRITDVQFQHNTAGVGIVLSFEDRDILDLDEAVNAFSVEMLRRRFMRILDREYYVDFPGRRDA